MALHRRSLLTLSAGIALAPLGWSPAALAQGAADPRLGERAVGRPDAPVKVQEFFSLTCSHCAAFHRETYPAVKRELIEKGQVRFIFRDFPLDQVALTASMVARSLPAERYEPFISTLLSTQDRWAFGRNAQEELAKVAALAGMPRAQFDAVVADEGLRRAILEQRLLAEREHNINATPSFVFNTRPTHSGGLGFDRFQQMVREASGG